MPVPGELEGGNPSDVPNYGEYRVSKLLEEIPETTNVQLLKSMREALESAQRRDPYNQQITQAITLLNAHCHRLINAGLLSPHSLEVSTDYPTFPKRETLTSGQRAIIDVTFKNIVANF
ncbi:MAG: hypothetical protein JWM52_781 [Candidatus Saccharibacteria bacterium]|nr:hypothetical protein [Candidatus Saccharibacteria bacterium]